MAVEGQFPKIDGDILFGSEVNSLIYPFGNIVDGARTISSNTVEGSVLDVQYSSLTIDGSVTWTLKDKSIIRVSGPLTINGTIEIAKSTTLTGGAGGGGAGGGTPPNGGAGGDSGGSVIIFTKTLVNGVGAIINANAGDGSNGVAPDAGTGDGTGGAGGAGSDGVFLLSNLDSNGNGGASNQTGTAAGGPQKSALISQNNIYDISSSFLNFGSGGGAGGGSSRDGGATRGGGGGGGGASGGSVYLKYSTITSPANLTINTLGGNGGNGAASFGAGSNTGGGGGGSGSSGFGIGGAGGTSGATSGGGGGGGGSGSGGLIIIIGENAGSINTSVLAGTPGIKGEADAVDGSAGGVGSVATFAN